MNGGGGGDRRYDELLQEHEQLKAELREQEEVRIPSQAPVYFGSEILTILAGHRRSPPRSYGVSEPDEADIRTC